MYNIMQITFHMLLFIIKYFLNKYYFEAIISLKERRSISGFIISKFK